jgi:hypothetical protein
MKTEKMNRRQNANNKDKAPFLWRFGIIKDFV